jgi:hypothetical protein
VLKNLCTHNVKNEIVLHITKKESDVLHTNKPTKANRIGQILCRNSFLKRVVEGKIVRRIKVGKLKQLQDDVKKKGTYWHLRESTRSRCGRLA